MVCGVAPCPPQDPDSQKHRFDIPTASHLSYGTPRTPQTSFFSILPSTLSTLATTASLTSWAFSTISALASVAFALTSDAVVDENGLNLA